VVVQDQARRAQRLCRLERQQFRVAGAGTDQGDARGPRARERLVEQAHRARSVAAVEDMRGL
jgi:hypothetical protein